ncbi:hypothetical protein Nepgr_030696 [Nepenthes gracilis]|uniref:Uncharacterized protein n=1 Tax=Nepenthes gracilis TaxID=150966 RepID=A0AAD3TH17_NEPGR|nr:hypothetical protein Nepgr_030696 [Nepenthes gracilis]
MEESLSVLLPAAARDVPCQSARKEQEGGLSSVFVTVAASGANSMCAGRLHKAAPIFARCMGEGKCSWGQPGSRFGNQDDDPCGSFAQGKMGLCSMHGALIQDKRVHGGVTLELLVENQNSSKLDNMKDLLSDDVNPWTIKIGTSATIIQELTGFPSAVNSPSSCPVAEGQVH